MEVLLHPRLPPLVRSLPGVESLSLFRAEESQEETDTRQSLGLVLSGMDSSIPDIVMVDPSAAPAPQKTNKSASVPASLEMPAPSLPPQALTQKPQQTSQPPPRDPETRNAPVSSPPPIKAIYDAPVQTSMPIAVEEEERNEEMPAIDLGSDSDSD